MKKIINLLVLVFLITLPEIRAELFLVDQIECVVCGPEKNAPIVNTDISYKGDLNGQQIPLQQQIQQEIIAQQIVSERLPFDITAADKYIDSIKKQNNLTDSDLADLFDGIGRTFTEGISLLNGQYQHELFVHHKFKSQVVATDDEINDYYEQHPIYQDGWCNIQMSYLDFDDSTKDSLKKQIDLLSQGAENLQDFKNIEWSSPILVSLRDVADDKRFIFDMKPSQIEARENGSTFELYKLLEKQDPRLKTIDECRSAIVDKLNRQKLEKTLEEYNKEVHKFIDIISFGESSLF
ncbi:hypothetical protein HYV11_01365 [Candidatus Dependentiae bacterium]|nr:hypothetical protein [Candidatus Dependentiae bacterium]